jgi:hypothetical protein
MNSIADAVKGFYARLSPFTRGALALLLIVVPDWSSRGGFWYSFVLGSWPTLKGAYESPYGKLALVVLALLVIWLDQRRLTRNQLGKQDPLTLRDRTLDVMNRMQTFLDELGPMPQGEFARFTGASQVRAGPDWRSPAGTMHDSAIVRANGGLSQRMAKVDYGYELYFASDVLRIYNEFAFRGVMDTRLKDLLFKEKRYKEETEMREIIQALSRLSELEEGTYPD